MSPIAIVGMSCRFAGAPDLHSYWELIADGRDAFGPVPADRWSEAMFRSESARDMDRSPAPRGAFMDDIQSFPALALGIPPRRVEVMDPQQRMCLHTAVEAIEDAGYLPSELPRSTGVFVGITAHEYRVLQSTRIAAMMMASGQLGTPPSDLDALAEAVERVVPPRPFSASGVLGNMCAAAVAQELDLHGPAYTTDAACASALVALQDAVAQLRAGLIDAALTGGAYLQITPEHFIAFARIGAMSESGHCLPFDARADGFVQGDGVGMVLLKRLDDALRDGDRIYATIEGVALNNDGRGDGPMAPSLDGQLDVLRAAWRDAGHDPAAVGYIEAHGTGTEVGDATELQGLRTIFGGGRAIALGSAKANVGHTMSAAGIAGLIKAALAIHHKTKPPMANFQKAKADLSDGTFVIPTAAAPWDDDRRLAGVSSFGFGGTNGHAVLAAPPLAQAEAHAQAELILLSAPDAPALSALARRTATAVRADATLTPAALARAWARRRRQPFRASIVASDRDALLGALDGLAAWSPGAELPVGARAGLAGPAPKLAYLYPGQGAQRPGMLRDLRQRFPVIASALADMDAATSGLLDRPLTHLLYPDERPTPVGDAEAMAELTRTEHTQPAMFAAGWALTALLDAVGLTPTVATGHSLGEFVAAARAGVLTAPDAIRFVSRRGRAMASLPGDHGAMAAVMADRATVEGLLVDGAVLANVNHPRQLVVSGTTDAVAQVVARAAAAGVQAKALEVSHAFHSPVLAALDSAALLEGVAFHDPSFPVASGIADRAYASAADARAVFLRHATSPVVFTGALQQCVDAGADLFLQVGAGGPLASFARGTLQGARGVLTLASLEDRDGGQSLLDTLGALWVAGADLDVLPITGEAPLGSAPPSVLPTEAYWAVKDKVTRALKLGDGNPRAREEAAPRAAPAPVEATPVEAEPAAAAPHAAADNVAEGVLRVVAKVSAYPRDALRTGARLVEDLGFDSLMMGDLSTGLAEAFPGIGGIPQAILVNGPTVADLIAFVERGPAAADDTSDQAPLRAWTVAWEPRPLPDLPARALPVGRWVISGPEPAAVARAADELRAAGMTLEIASVEALLAESAPITGLLWVGAPVTPRVASVLSGRAAWPDAAGPLLAVLARQDHLGARPDVLAMAAADDPWTAALRGALLALSREWPEAVIKHVETDDRAMLARRVVPELVSADRGVEVRWTGGKRYAPALRPADAVPAEPLRPDDVVVITGGTRGIGLRLGLRLAPDVGRVLLVGRSAPADADAAAIGAFANVRVLRADVRDLAELKAALKGEAPTVLVHAAGVLADGPLAQVDAAQGETAREIKAGGWIHALRACGATLRRAVGVGSWAGRFGNRHQAHYAAANALLAELAAHAPRHVIATVAEFGPWTDSDMARTIPAAAKAAMRSEGVDFVATEPGLEALVEALGAPAGVRVLGRDLPARPGRVVVDFTVSTATDPWLLDHALDGTPVVALAAATDWMAWVAGVPAPFEVCDVTLFQGITVREPVALRVEAHGDRVAIRQGPQRALAYTARVRALTAAPDVGAPRAGGEPPTLDPARFYAEATFHGPLLQGVVSFGRVGADFVHGTVRGGAPAAWTPGTPRAAFTVDPLALDSAMQLAASVAWVRWSRAGTPVRIGRVAALGPIPPNKPLAMEARFGESTQDRFTATLILRDDLGRPLLVAEDVTAELRKVGGELPFTPEAVDLTLWPEVRSLAERFAGVQQLGVPNPYFHVHEGTAAHTTSVAGRRLVNFSSYNYLGLSGDPDVLAAVHAAVERYGTSVSASRVASGERPFHGELEAMLARAQGAEAAVLFTAGHATNVTTIGHLFGPEDLILHDEYIHDSAFQGIKLSGAQRRMFRHEDAAHLEKQLRDLRAHYRRCLIVVEGVYSMDGDICDLPSYVALKKKYGCLLMVDEAHSFGIVGATGRGVSEHYGIDGREVDIWMGTISKSLASCGGWIAGSRTLVDLLKYTAPGFVYSAGLTAANGVAALASLKKMLAEPWRVRRLQDNASFFQRELAQRGIDTGPARGGTGVVPVITGNSIHAMLLSTQLREQGVNVQPIVYPAVPEDAARLRFFLSSTHTREELYDTAVRVAATLEAIRAAVPGAGHAT